MVEQVLVFGAGLVGRNDGQLHPGDLPDGNGLAGGQFGAGRDVWRGVVAQGLQTDRSGFAGEERQRSASSLARCIWPRKVEPLLRPGLQALLAGAVGFLVGVLGLGRIPAVQAGLDVALEDFEPGSGGCRTRFRWRCRRRSGRLPVRAWSGSGGRVRYRRGWHTPASTCIQGWGSVVRVSCTHWR
jgi:hypothetical protein